MLANDNPAKLHREQKTGGTKQQATDLSNPAMAGGKKGRRPTTKRVHSSATEEAPGEHPNNHRTVGGPGPNDFGQASATTTGGYQFAESEERGKRRKRGVCKIGEDN